MANTTEDKLRLLAKSKTDIMNAIKSKKVPINDTVPLSEYDVYIKQIRDGSVIYSPSLDALKKETGVLEGDIGLVYNPETNYFSGLYKYQGGAWLLLPTQLTASADTIAPGFTGYGVNGVEEGHFTSDATAIAEEIIERKIAYAKGKKLIGTIREVKEALDFTAESYNFTCPDNNYNSGRFTTIRLDDDNYLYIKICTGPYLAFYKLDVFHNTITTLKKISMSELGISRGTLRCTHIDLSEEFNERGDRHLLICFWDGGSYRGSNDYINLMDINIRDLDNIIVTKQRFYESQAGEIKGAQFFKTNPNKFSIGASNFRIYTINPDTNSVTYITSTIGLDIFRYLGHSSLQANDKIFIADTTDTNKRSLACTLLNTTQDFVSEFSINVGIAGAQNAIFFNQLGYALIGNYLYTVTWGGNNIPSFQRVSDINVIPDFGNTRPEFVAIDEQNEILYCISSNKGCIYKLTIDGTAFNKLIEVQASFNYAGGWGGPASGSYPIIRPDSNYMMTTNGNSIILTRCVKGALETNQLVYKGDPFFRIVEASATAQDVLAGKKVYGAIGKIVGIMPNNGELEYTPTAQDQSIPLGYTSGGVVKGDVNLNPVNIPEGKTIFGVEGNYLSVPYNLKIRNITTDLTEPITITLADLLGNTISSVPESEKEYNINYKDILVKTFVNGSLKSTKNLSLTQDSYLDINIQASASAECSYTDNTDLVGSVEYTKVNSGTPTIKASPTGENALYLNGSSDVRYNLKYPSTDFLLEFEFYKADAGRYSRIMACFGVEFEIEVKESSSKIYWGAEYTSTWAQNQWNKLKLEKVGSSVTLTINDSVVATRTYNKDLTGFIFGRGLNSGNTFNGYYRNLKIEVDSINPELTLEAQPDNNPKIYTQIDENNYINNAAVGKMYEGTGDLAGLTFFIESIVSRGTNGNMTDVSITCINKSKETDIGASKIVLVTLLDETGNEVTSGKPVLRIPAVGNTANVSASIMDGAGSISKETYDFTVAIP